jgi:hypothetical protein
VWLDGVDGYRYYFAHLSSSLTSFVGQKVPMGRVIGLVGNTGNAITTPPHLHFEIHVNGQKNPQSADPSSSGRINPYPLLAKAQAEGATSITPWQQLLGWDSSLFGEAAASAASASMMEFTRPDLEARALRAARSTALYKELFAAKPEGISDVEYATTFGNRAAQTAGVSSPEAARVGMQYNSLEAMWGRLIADEEALDESPTLRGRLHGIGQSFIDAMGGRQ